VLRVAYGQTPSWPKTRSVGEFVGVEVCKCGSVEVSKGVILLGRNIVRAKDVSPLSSVRIIASWVWDADYRVDL